MFKEHIMMVDDDSDDQMIVADTLSEIATACRVSLAASGKQAMALLDSLKNDGHLPCLIVLDLNMPVFNGIQTLEMIRKDARFREIPVCIYTTSLNPMEKDKAVALGIVGFELKPTSFDEAAIICRRFLDYCK